MKLKFKSKKKVKTFNLALGQKNVNSIININFLESTSSLPKINTSSKWYLFKKFIFRNRTIKEKQKIKVKKLDSIEEILKIKQVSLIKIDTYFKRNNFIFLKKFKFPFIPFSDRIYLNSKFLKNS